jgi:hypothetical protein
VPAPATLAPAARSGNPRRKEHRQQPSGQHSTAHPTGGDHGIDQAGTVTGLVALLSFKTHGGTIATPPPGISAAGPDTTSGSASTGTRTVTGNAVNTVWGPVQVRIAVTDGKLANATAVEYPWNNPLDQLINSYEHAFYGHGRRGKRLTGWPGPGRRATSSPVIPGAPATGKIARVDHCQ